MKLIIVGKEMAYQNTHQNTEWIVKLIHQNVSKVKPQLFIRQNGIILNKGNMYFYSPDPALNLHSEKFFSMVVSGSLQASMYLESQIDQLF